MATLNKYMCIGRFTRDPEPRTFNGGGRMVRFGLAVNNRKKTADGWEDDPVFIDVAMFGKQDSKVLDIVAEMKKGQQIFVEGRLQLEQWQDKSSGQNRQKISLVAENVQFLEPKKDDGVQGGYQGQGQQRQQGQGQQQGGYRGNNQGGGRQPGDDDIPF